MATNPINPGAGLEIDFLGLPMVFNDGKAQNHLVIALTNNNFFATLNPAQDSNIVFDRKSSISVWFVVDVAQASVAAVRNWALTSYDEWHDAKVALTAGHGNWDIRRSDDLSGNPLNESLNGWQLTPREDLTLLPGQSLVLTLSGFTSASPDGPTSGYVQVLMPPFDASGKATNPIQKVIGPIIKSRVMIAGERMGIGTGTPNSTLEVNGAVRARGGDPGPDDINNNGFFFDGGGDSDSGMTSLGEGNLTFYASGQKVISIDEKDVYVIGPAPIRDANTIVEGNLTIRRFLQSDQPGGDLKVEGNTTVNGNFQARGSIQDQWGPLLPVGTIVAYGGKEPPPGWLLCDGQFLVWNEPDEGDTVDEYAELRRLVGANVPDLRDRFIVGAGNTIGDSGTTGGEADHMLTFDEMPKHRHGMYVASNQEANYGYVGDEGIKQQWYAKVADRKGPVADPYSGSYRDDIRAKTIIEAGGGLAHNNMPPYYALTYIIKY